MLAKMSEILEPNGYAMFDYQSATNDNTAQVFLFGQATKMCQEISPIAYCNGSMEIVVKKSGDITRQKDFSLGIQVNSIWDTLREANLLGLASPSLGKPWRSF